MVNQQNNLAKFNLCPNRKIKGWTLSKQLGSGGNGEVWMCRNAKKENMPSNSLSMVVMGLLMPDLEMRFCLWSNIKIFMVCYL